MRGAIAIALLCVALGACSSGRSNSIMTHPPTREPVTQAPSPPASAHPIVPVADLVSTLDAAGVPVEATDEALVLGCPDDALYRPNTVYGSTRTGDALFALWEYRTAEERARLWAIGPDGVARPRAACRIQGSYYVVENLVVRPEGAGAEYEAVMEAVRVLNGPRSVYEGLPDAGSPLDGRQLIWALEDIGLHFRTTDTGYGCSGLKGYATSYEGLYQDPGFLLFSVWTYASTAELEREWSVDSYGTAIPKAHDCVLPGAAMIAHENLILDFGRSWSTHADLQSRIIEAFLSLDATSR